MSDDIVPVDLSIGFLLDIFKATSIDHCDDIWWRTDGEYAPLTVFVNCNDLFHWGTSDSEQITNENLSVLIQSYKDSKDYGSWLFCSRVRKMRPQGAAYHYIPKEEWEFFHACGPERKTGFGNPLNPGDEP